MTTVAFPAVTWSALPYSGSWAMFAQRLTSSWVYKIDRLARSLFDFAKIVEAFDARGVSSVSITQHGVRAVFSPKKTWPRTNFGNNS
jgi:hypothetical protein